jgi:hypothetical protein
MLKKMFIVWGAVFCLQAAQSEIINISGGWKQMHEEILSRVRNFSGNAMVGLDCDDIMFYFDENDESQLTDGMLIATLQDLERAQVPFFCMTAAVSTEWLNRRRDFEKVGISRFFREKTRSTSEEPNIISSFISYLFNQMTQCLLGEWREERHDGKKYYVDTEWNTVYTRRAIGSVYTEQNPFDYQKYKKFSNEKSIFFKESSEYIRYQEYIKFAKNCHSESKGYVFSELIKDGVIAKPDLFIFVDDRIRNLNDIEESCAQRGIPFVGLHCRSYIQQ